MEKRKFLDDKFWRKLASKYGVRMPNKSNEGSKYVWRFCARLGVPKRGVYAALGSSLNEFMDLNPEWPAYAIAGLILEDKYYSEKS